MITFILLFAGAVVVIAGFLVANAANQRKRTGMAGSSHVVAQQEKGGGSAPVGRPTGTN